MLPSPGYTGLSGYTGSLIVPEGVVMTNNQLITRSDNDGSGKRSSDNGSAANQPSGKL